MENEAHVSSCSPLECIPTAPGLELGFRQCSEERGWRGLEPSCIRAARLQVQIVSFARGLLFSWGGLLWVSMGSCLLGVGFRGFLSLGVVSVGFCLLGLGFRGFLSSWGWVSMGFHGFLPSWGGFPLVSMVFVVVLGWISMVCCFFLSFGGEFPWVLVFLELVSVGSCLPEVVSMGFCLLEVGFCGFPCFFVVLGWVSMSFHRITAWLGFKGTSRTIKFQSPCPRQGCPLLNHILDQVAQSPIQPGIKYLQRVFSKSRNGF